MCRNAASLIFIPLAFLGFLAVGCGNSTPDADALAKGNPAPAPVPAAAPIPASAPAPRTPSAPNNQPSPIPFAPFPGEPANGGGTNPGSPPNPNGTSASWNPTPVAGYDQELLKVDASGNADEIEVPMISRNQSVVSPINCLSSAAAGVRSGDNGIIVLDGSVLLYRRNLSSYFYNGRNAQPNVAFACGNKDSFVTDPSVPPNVTIVALHAGQAKSDNLRYSEADVPTNAAVASTVSCSGQTAVTRKLVPNGITMLKNSGILLRRNQPGTQYFLYTCE